MFFSGELKNFLSFHLSVLKQRISSIELLRSKKHVFSESSEGEVLINVFFNDLEENLKNLDLERIYIYVFYSEELKKFLLLLLFF